MRSLIATNILVSFDKDADDEAEMASSIDMVAGGGDESAGDERDDNGGNDGVINEECCNDDVIDEKAKVTKLFSMTGLIRGVMIIH